MVVGGSGGIGLALAQDLVSGGRYDAVHALSRRVLAPPPGVRGGQIDLLDEASILSAFEAIDFPLALVIVATGLLQGEGVAPERNLAALDPAALAHSFAVNAVGPALVAKHALPRFPKDRRAVFVALSARVGSIADNRLGGWYGYRASKAALNMMVRCAAIELERIRPLAICVMLHPGTVDTGLSRPFQRGVPEGRLFAPADAAGRLLAVIDDLTAADSGGFFAYDGTPIPF